MKKRWAVLLVVVLILVMFAGCSEAKAPDLLTVRQVATGATISIGDTRSDVTAITGEDVRSGFDFLEDDTTGDFYWDAPGIRVDYHGDDVVRLLLLNTADWELMNGLYCGMPKNEAEALYRDVAEKEAGQMGGLFISYDENLNPIPLNEFSPYYFRITFTDEGTVESAYIKYNFAQ
jgi:hypothetical protein